MAKRAYDNDYPSVTQVLGVLRKIGLEMWYKWNTAKFCDEKSKKGKEIGTLIHQAIQDHIEKKEVKVETEYGEEVMNALKSFMLFKKDYPNIKLDRAELKLTNEDYFYNGTLDCLGNDGIPVILDWKTSECKVGTSKEKEKPDIYDDFIYQVSAYVYAYNEQEKKDIQRAYILSLAKDKVAYNLQKLERKEIDENFTDVFLPALRIYNFQNKKKTGGW